MDNAWSAAAAAAGAAAAGKYYTVATLHSNLCRSIASVPSCIYVAAAAAVHLGGRRWPVILHMVGSSSPLSKMMHKS